MTCWLRSSPPISSSNFWTGCIGTHEPFEAPATGGARLSPDIRMLPLPWQRVEPLDCASAIPLVRRAIKTDPLERESLRIISPPSLSCSQVTPLHHKEHRFAINERL